MELSRRHALAGAAALAASPILAHAPARAAAPVADKQAPSFYRYKVGDAQVTAISDGVNNFALPDTFVLNAKKDEVNAALEKAFMPKDKMSHPVRAAGDQHRWQAGRGRHRQRRCCVCFQQGQCRPVRRQHGGRGLRSEGGRHGGDLAFPRRSHQRPSDRREHAWHSPTPRCSSPRRNGSTSWTTAR